MPLESLERRTVLDSALSSFAGLGWGWEKLVNQNGFPFQQESVEQRGQFDLGLKKEEEMLCSQSRKSKNKNNKQANNNPANPPARKGDFQYPTREGRHTGFEALPEVSRRALKMSESLHS